MSEVQAFDNGEFQLNITPTGDSFRVEAPGLAQALGIRDAYRLVETIPDEEKGYTTAWTPGGEQRVWCVTEAGFYRAIGQRQAARIKDPGVRDQVVRFQGWIYGEVLPAIRRTGSYAPAPQVPQSYAQALRAAAEAEEAREAAERRTAELEPAAQAWGALADAHGDYSLREAAQILDRDPAISTGEKRLARTLRDAGWCAPDGQPYQRHVDTGRLRRRAVTYAHPRTGEQQAATQTRVTAKGLEELRRYLGGGGQLALIPGGAA